MLVDPLTESEMIQWSPPKKVNHGVTTRGTAFIYWQCYCGLSCKIAMEVMRNGARGGSCKCGSDWNVDMIDMSAVLVAPVQDRYTFVLIVDRDSSWKIHRRKSVGVNYENLR